MNKELLIMHYTYSKINKNLVKLIKDLKLTDVDEIYVALNYMLNHRYLTNKLLIYPENITEEQINLDVKYFNLTNERLLISSGFNTCRHRADITRKLFASLGLKSSQIFIYQPKFNLNINTFAQEISKEHLQKIIDLTLSSSEFESITSWEKTFEFDGIEFAIKYKGASASELYIGNHTLAIVEDKTSTHLFDTCDTLKIGAYSPNQINI